MRPALALVAFVVGISLLLYSGGAWLFVAFALSPNTRGELADSFRGDYQQTAAFRRAVGEDCVSLLEYGARVEFPQSSSEDSGLVGPAPMAAGDLNLLYRVDKDGVTLDTNTQAALAGPEELPAGYNFLLICRGTEAFVWKDGQTVEVPGTAQGTIMNWYVSDWEHIAPTLSQDAARVTVYLAVAEKPADYGAGYGPYEIVRDMGQVRALCIWLLAVPTAAGAALFLLSLAWRQHRRRAVRGVAWCTGHIWLEIKVALLVPLAMLWSMGTVACIQLYASSYLSSPLWLAGLLGAIWCTCLYANDLRYNFGALRAHSLCATCLRLFRRLADTWPAARRLERRALAQFLLALPFVLVWAAQIPVLYARQLYWGIGPLILLLLLLAGAALVAGQLRLMWANRRLAADLDRLLTYIQAAGAGAEPPPPDLPAGSDLAQAAASLGRMEDGLRAALEERMKSERMKVELIANVSHDLKTPLTSIISYTELLRQEEGLPDHVADYIRILSQKAGRLESMVRDVFEVSKAAAGSLPVALTPLDYAKLLRQTLADMDGEVQASAATLRPRLPDGPVWIEADGDRLYRVFQNLIGNALKYALDGSRIYLDLTVEGDRAAATVRNISRDELPQGVDLTERFVRGDTSRTDGGSGLGLSIARTFTEACGGTFTLRIEADLFTVAVAFPLTQKRPPEEEPLPDGGDG